MSNKRDSDYTRVSPVINGAPAAWAQPGELPRTPRASKALEISDDAANVLPPALRSTTHADSESRV